MGAVGLHGHHLVGIVEGVDQALGELQRGFAAGDDHQARRILPHLLHYLLVRHLGALLMLRVAERAMQVAAAEAHKDRRRAHVVAFTLQGIEYFVYFHNSSTS